MRRSRATRPAERQTSAGTVAAPCLRLKPQSIHAFAHSVSAVMTAGSFCCLPFHIQTSSGGSVHCHPGTRTVAGTCTACGPGPKTISGSIPCRSAFPQNSPRQASLPVVFRGRSDHVETPGRCSCGQTASGNRSGPCRAGQTASGNPYRARLCGPEPRCSARGASHRDAEPRGSARPTSGSTPLPWQREARPEHMTMKLPGSNGVPEA